MRCWGEEAQGTYRLVIRDTGGSCCWGPGWGWGLGAPAEVGASPAGAAACAPLAPCPGELPAQHPGCARWKSSLLLRPVSSPGDESLRPGTLKQWQLTLYGSSWSPAEMKERQR